MTLEQQRLCNLIEGHCAAMIAQVMDPGVTLEYLSVYEWKRVQGGLNLFSQNGPCDRVWYRVPKAPRLIQLDQSDFLGVNRVTHLRSKGCTGAWAVIFCDEHGIYLHNQIWVAYNSMQQRECSRDFGSTWGPCSKESKA